MTTKRKKTCKLLKSKTRTSNSIPTFLQLLLFQTQLSSFSLANLPTEYTRQEVSPGAQQVTLNCKSYNENPITKVTKLSGPGQPAENVYIRKIIPEKYRALWAWRNNKPMTLQTPLQSRYYNGTYMCITETDEITFAHQVDLIILEPPERPECEWPMGKVLAINETVQFSCFSTNGQPRPEYIWYRNGAAINQKIAAREGIHFSTDSEGRSFLNIKKVGNMHEGEWKCASYNRVNSQLKLKNTCQEKKFEIGTITQKMMLTIIIVSAAGIVLIILLFALLCFCCCRQAKNDGYQEESGCNCCEKDEYFGDDYDDMIGENDIEIDAGVRPPQTEQPRGAVAPKIVSQSQVSQPGLRNSVNSYQQGISYTNPTGRVATQISPSVGPNQYHTNPYREEPVENNNNGAYVMSTSKSNTHSLMRQAVNNTILNPYDHQNATLVTQVSQTNSPNTTPRQRSSSRSQTPNRAPQTAASVTAHMQRQQMMDERYQLLMQQQIQQQQQSQQRQ